MKYTVKSMVLSAIALCFATSVFAAKVAEGFEDKAVLKKWEIEGDVAISADQFHGGKTALMVPAAGSAVLRFAPENRFGTVSFWMYDSCVNVSQSSMKKNWNGPYFGLVNSDDDKAILRIIWRVKNAPPSGFTTTFTAENQMFTFGWASVTRKKAGWSKITFSFTDEKTLGATFNDETEVKSFSDKIEFFNKGANGIVMNGGDNIKEKNETFFYDDIEIDVSAPAAKEKAK